MAKRQLGVAPSLADHAATKTYVDSAVSGATGVSVSIKTYGAVGNGSNDDTVSIQNALNAVSAAGGGTVGVPVSTGSYIFTALNIPSNVTFKGLGGTLKLKDNTTITATIYYPIQIASRTNVHLVDLIIDGNNANNPGDWVATVADLVTWATCSNSSMRNCRIMNPPDTGIMFSRMTNSSLLNNIITGATDLGIYVNDGDGTLFSECLIQGNIITDCTYGGIGLKRSLQRVILANNTIRDCGNGITLEQTTGTDFPNNMTITGNRMRHIGYNTGGHWGTPAGYGIDILGSNYVLCTSNQIEDATNFGIKIESGKYNTFSSNYINHPNTGQAAIACLERTAIATGAQNNTFVGNIVVGGPKGFWLGGASGKPSDSITLIGNHIISAFTTGLAVDQFVTNLTLMGNVFGGGTNAVNINASAGVIYAINNRLLSGAQVGTFNPPGTVKLLAVATGSRPTATSVGAGTMLYDTTLSKPVWSNGSVYKDAAGTTV